MVNTGPYEFNREEYVKILNDIAKDKKGKGKRKAISELNRIEREDRAFRQREKEIELKEKRNKLEEKYYAQEFQARAREEKELTAAQRRRRNEEITKDILGTNFQPRNFTSQITAWTATQAIRKPYTRSGLRNEFVSRGYTGRSGFPELDNAWSDTTGSTTRGRVKGNLAIGRGGFGFRSNVKPVVKANRVYTDRIIPDFNILTGGISGDVIMPTMGILKIRKRKI